MKSSILFLLALSFISLTACVEVRDPEEKPTDEIVAAPSIPVEAKEKKPDLLIREDMFVYQGQILTMDQIERLTYKGTQNWTPSNLTLRYGKIEITSEGVLYTMGNNLTLIADELYSSGGKIETMPAGSKAPLNHPGMNGGYLTVQAGGGEGMIEVVLRGQDGGDGLAAPPISDYRLRPLAFCVEPFPWHILNASMGTPGRAGGDTGSFRAKGELKSLDFRPKFKPGRGGNGGASNAPARCPISDSPLQWREGAPAPAPTGPPGPDGQILN